MTLSSRNLLVRWAFFGETRPYATDLCSLFWRTVLFTPLKLLACGVACSVAGVFVAIVIVEVLDAGVLLVLTRVALVGGGLVAFGMVLWYLTETVPVATDPVSQGIRYVKTNYCPRIEIRGPQEGR